MAPLERRRQPRERKRLPGFVALHQLRGALHGLAVAELSDFKFYPPSVLKPSLLHIS